MQSALGVPLEVPDHIQVAEVPLPAVVLDVHVLLDMGIVHEGQDAGGVDALVLLGADLLDALAIDVGDVGAGVHEGRLDFVLDQQALLAVLARRAVVDELPVTLLRDEVVVLQVLHRVGGVLEVRVTLVGHRAGVLQQEALQVYSSPDRFAAVIVELDYRSSQPWDS